MSTSDIKLHDHVKLSDNRTGFVVDLYDKPGLPIAYEVEIEKSRMETITVNRNDIIEILK